MADIKEKAASADNYYDVIVVGAGISGIDVAYRLQEQTPDRTYAILEARDNIGGTWDLFKFPGIRSDSDLYTFGFPFKPWNHKNSIAEADMILEYMHETTREFGIDRNIKFRHRVESANWSSDQQMWSMDVTADGKQTRFHSQFVMLCTGYYDYKNPLPANIPGIENFQGKIVHPQFWPEDLDYTGKNVTIIGSGATAITLLPNVAKKAAVTTMLQRSPSFIVAVPQNDPINNFFRNWFPAALAHRLIRFKMFVLPHLFFRFCRTFPNAARKMLKTNAAKLLPEGYPMDPNFEPKYNPWDQRLCVTPKGDFFDAIKKGVANVVTGEIKTIDKDTIYMKNSNTTLKPDIIVTATGLRLQIAGGTKLSVDNQPINIPDKHLYRGIMLQDVPNAAVVIGYTNASWTLGADATAQFVTRLLNHMKKNNYTEALARVNPDIPMKEQSVLNLNSTYIVKSQSVLPKAGDVAPWKPRSMYLRDLWDAQHAPFTDMHFSTVST